MTITPYQHNFAMIYLSHRLTDMQRDRIDAALAAIHPDLQSRIAQRPGEPLTLRLEAPAAWGCEENRLVKMMADAETATRKILGQIGAL